MSSIITPGQHRMSSGQAQALKRAEEKQKFLSAVARWSIFIESDTEAIVETEVGKAILGNVGKFKEAYPQATMDALVVLNSLHHGARQIFVEQEYMRGLANQDGKSIPEEQSVAMAAKITSLTEAICLHDPNVVGTPSFRACLLAFELGFLVPDDKAEEDISPSDASKDEGHPTLPLP